MAAGLNQASIANKTAPITRPANSAGTRQKIGERPLFQISRRSRDSVNALSLQTTPRKVAKGKKGGSRSGSRSTVSCAMPAITWRGSPLNKAICGHRSMVRAMAIKAADTIMVWRR